MASPAEDNPKPPKAPRIDSGNPPSSLASPPPLQHPQNTQPIAVGTSLAELHSNPPTLSLSCLKAFYPIGTVVIHTNKEFQISSWQPLRNIGASFVELRDGSTFQTVEIRAVQPKIDIADLNQPYLLFDPTIDAYFPGKFSKQINGPSLKYSFIYDQADGTPSPYSVEYVVENGLLKRAIPLTSTVFDTLQGIENIEPSRIVTQKVFDQNTNKTYVFKGYDLSEVAPSKQRDYA